MFSNAFHQETKVNNLRNFREMLFKASSPQATVAPQPRKLRLSPVAPTRLGRTDHVLPNTYPQGQLASCDTPRRSRLSSVTSPKVPDYFFKESWLQSPIKKRERTRTCKHLSSVIFASKLFLPFTSNLPALLFPY